MRNLLTSSSGSSGISLVMPSRMSCKVNGKTMERTIRSTDSRLVVLGAAGVGKSALVVRYLTNRFIWEYDPTLECTYKHHAHIDDESVLLEILDTAGQDNNQHFEGNVRWGDAFMIVYSVTDRQSFQEVSLIKRHLDDIRKIRNVSCVIVGNKTDLEHERCVTYEEGEKMAADLACAFFETSACEGRGEIVEAFHELHRESKRRRLLEGKARRRSSAQQVRQVLNKMLTKIQSG